MTANPFVQLYEQGSEEGDRWNFYYVSDDLRYSEDGESLTTGIKLNCKFVRSMCHRLQSGEWATLDNTLLIKDVGIDAARSKKGYFTQFLWYLLLERQINVLYLESVQPRWLIERLEAPGSLWIKQSIQGREYILLKNDTVNLEKNGRLF
jgi:hypothetical protein